MVMPLTIMAVAKSRKASSPRPGCQSRNAGAIRLRMRANITTKMGRLLVIVETRDTGPLSIAQSDSTMAIGASNSFKPIMARAVFLCFILISCLRTWRRIETTKKIVDIQSALTQNKFQNEM